MSQTEIFVREINVIIWDDNESNFLQLLSVLLSFFAGWYLSNWYLLTCKFVRECAHAWWIVRIGSYLMEFGKSRALVRRKCNLGSWVFDHILDNIRISLDSSLQTSHGWNYVTYKHDIFIIFSYKFFYTFLATTLHFDQYFLGYDSSKSEKICCEMWI